MPCASLKLMWYYQLYVVSTDKQTSPGILPRTLILISVRPRSGSVGHDAAHASYLPADSLLQLCTDFYKIPIGLLSTFVWLKKNEVDL